MTPDPRGNSRRWLALALAASIGWTLGLHLARLPALTGEGGSAFVAGRPLLTTADGYYYLRLAEESAGGTYRRPDELRPRGMERPARVPPVSAMAAMLHKVTSIPARELAFHLPPALAAFSSLAMALAGWAVAGPWGGLAAGLAGAASPFWFVRCSLGWFDTDPLNLFFPTLAALALTGFVFGPWSAWSPASPSAGPEPWRTRLARLALCAACVAGLTLWWPSVGLLALPLFCLAYGSSLMAPSSRAERLAKLGLLLSMAAGAGILGLGLHRHLPQALASLSLLGDSALGHLGLITKQGSGAFAEVGQSISELTPMEPGRLAKDLAGGWPPLAAAVAGLILAARRRVWPVLLLVLPFLLLGALAGFAQRFVIFLVPAYALGLALFVAGVLDLPRIRRLRPTPRRVLAALLVAALAAPGTHPSLSRPFRPAFDAAQAALAMSINPARGNKGLLWNWWDQGYFLQYFTRLPTIIDGGSQDPERIFLASLPLATEDPVLAANWIRFVAVRGPQGFQRLSRRLGGARPAAELLRKVLAAPGEAEALLAAAGLAHGWKSFLFPAARKPVFVYLTTDIIYRGWWYYYGNLFGERESDTPPRTLLVPASSARIDIGQGLLLAGDKAMLLSELVDVRRAGIERHAGVDSSGPVALRMEGAPHLTILNRPMFRSLACQLLFGDPKGVPGFMLLTHHPFVGGVWLVQ